MNLIDKLPHKRPALLLDDVIQTVDDTATCTVARTIHPSLLSDGRIPVALGLEIMAQTAAIWMIWKYPEERSQGMLVQCKELDMHVDSMDAKEGLCAHAHALSYGSATGLYLFHGEIRSGDNVLLCSATFMLLAKGISA